MNFKTLTFHVRESGKTIAHELRATAFDGSRWFVAKDLCLMLGLNVRASGEPNTAVALRHLDRSDKCVRRVHVASNMLARTAFVNDAGFYKLVLRSRRVASRTLARWASRNIDPAIGAALAIERQPTTLASALRDRAAALDALANHYDATARKAA